MALLSDFDHRNTTGNQFLAENDHIGYNLKQNTLISSQSTVQVLSENIFCQDVVKKEIIWALFVPKN